MCSSADNPECAEIVESALLFVSDQIKRNLPMLEETLYEFLESTYDAGAGLAHWDRAALEW